MTVHVVEILHVKGPLQNEMIYAAPQGDVLAWRKRFVCLMFLIATFYVATTVISECQLRVTTEQASRILIKVRTS